MKKGKVDKVFLIIVSILVFIGFSIFLSASLGVLVKSKEIFYSIIFNQLVFGLGLGLIGMFIFSRLDYYFWQKYSFHIFLGAILITAAVFIPFLGWGYQGAERWIRLGSFSFQPVEFLKIGFIMYFATWLSLFKSKRLDPRFNLISLLGLFALVTVILFQQPDTKSFILILTAGISMLFVSEVPIKYVLWFSLGSIIIVGSFAFFNPYLQERIKTFIDPQKDPLGSSYQIQQSLMSLGSGKVWGRGYGQSIQKFSYLPESHGDSIFSVIGEEFGFIGSSVIIILYLLFAFHGLRISNQAPDLFSRLLVLGIVILIIAQSYMNIASIVGVFPLTGVPLVFISHGGTSLMVYLMAIGIVFQVSRKMKYQR
jgi:cell division protein FtsW